MGLPPINVFGYSEYNRRCYYQALEEEEEVPKLPPMFLTEFVLDTAQLTFLPDEEEFQDKIAEVIKQFQVID